MTITLNGKTFTRGPEALVNTLFKPVNGGTASGYYDTKGREVRIFKPDGTLDGVLTPHKVLAKASIINGQTWYNHADLDTVGRWDSFMKRAEEIEAAYRIGMSAFPNTAREFPDFDQTTLPAIPAGFEDVSWHNDSCPSFLNEKAGLIIFTDYADPALREFEEGPRFNLNTWDNGNCDTLRESDDWQDILDAIDKALPLPTTKPTADMLDAELDRACADYSNGKPDADDVQRHADAIAARYGVTVTIDEEQAATWRI